jgi:aspartate aminotransferase
MPAYNQEGARLAITSPESLSCIREMAAAFQQRRDVVVRELNRIDGISCQLPRGAFYAFPNVAGVCERLGAVEAFESLPPDARDRTSPSTLFQLFLLYRYHVATMDRPSFGRIGSEGKHFLRISIATALEDLRTAVERIGLAAKDEAGFREFFNEGKISY